MSLILYLIGAAIAYLWLLFLYDSTPDFDRVEASEAVSIFCIGMLASWLTVAILLYAKLIRKNKDD